MNKFIGFLRLLLNDPDDALAMFERVEEIVDDVHALKATAEKLRERIDYND